MRCKFFDAGYCNQGGNCRFVHASSDYPKDKAGGSTSVFNRVGQSASVFGQTKSSSGSNNSSVFGNQNSFSTQQKYQETLPSSNFGSRQVPSVFGRTNTAQSSFDHSNDSGASAFGRGTNNSTNSAFSLKKSTNTSVFRSSNIHTDSSAAVSVFGQQSDVKSSLSKITSVGVADVNIAVSMQRDSQADPDCLKGEEGEQIYSVSEISAPKMLFGRIISHGTKGIKQLTYSRTDELSAEEIEAFNSNTFSLGTIPINPPPIKLCN